MDSWGLYGSLLCVYGLLWFALPLKLPQLAPRVERPRAAALLLLALPTVVSMLRFARNFELRRVAMQALEKTPFQVQAKWMGITALLIPLLLVATAYLAEVFATDEPVALGVMVLATTALTLGALALAV